MYIIEIPYEWLKNVFGTYIADNFNTICLCLCIVGLFASVLRGSNRYHKHQKTNTQRNWNDHYEKIDKKKQQKNQTEYDSRTDKWTPSGWVFNKETQLWEPPDYLSSDSKNKWRWDDEKKIWIDIEKERRLARYREYHKDKPPTFEEWKAAREAEKKNEHPEK